MLTLQIKEKEIENLTPEEEFVRGTVGAKCQINFDEFWQSYNKYIVFKRVGYEPINFMVDTLENEIEIPYTILAESGEFKIGVFGTTETETLPTLYSKDIKILYGTDTHGTTPPTYIPSEIDQLRLSKQDKLVSGENIKTVNGESILGAGNIKIQVEVDQTYTPDSENAQSGIAVAEALSGYVMAEVGKGLSSNDFTNEDKEKLYSALQNENIDKTYNPTSENAQSGIAVKQAVDGVNTRVNNEFTNALKGNKSGSVFLINDISPVTHNMGVKVRGKNLFDVDMSFTNDNKVTDGAATGYLTYFIQLQPNTKYYAKCFAPVTTDVTVTILSSNKAVNSSVGKGIALSRQLAGWKTELALTTDDTGRLYIGNNANNLNKIKEILSACNLQLELGTTATAYTPYVPDLTAVKVSTYGKNLLSAMSLYPTVTNNAVPIHFKAGQKYTISFTTTYTTWRLMFLGTDKNETAFDASSQNTNKYISGMYTGATGRLQHANNQSGNTLTFTCNEDCIITAIVFWNVANETDKFYFDFQLELGTTATDYEPYKEYTEYTPTADGTVNGVKSLYPTTMLMTDTEGTIIEAEYNRDINKAFAELQQAILSLGGNI